MLRHKCFTSKVAICIFLKRRKRKEGGILLSFSSQNFIRAGSSVSIHDVDLKFKVRFGKTGYFESKWFFCAFYTAVAVAATNLPFHWKNVAAQISEHYDVRPNLHKRWLFEGHIFETSIEHSTLKFKMNCSKKMLAGVQLHTII